MRRCIAIALFLNAALLGVRAWQEAPHAQAVAIDEARSNGDVNGDADIDVSDAVYLLRYLFQGGPLPVAIAQEGGLTPEQSEILNMMSLEEIIVDDQGTTAKTIRISGANLQVVNGMGATNGRPGAPEASAVVESNGLGNLIIGYQEPRRDEDGVASGNNRSGSHCIVVGGFHNYTSVGGTVIGYSNSIAAPYAAVTGGWLNVASGRFSSVTGGEENTAPGLVSYVSGGLQNSASGHLSSAMGGEKNDASGRRSTIAGGLRSVSSGSLSNVFGAEEAGAGGVVATIIGGYRNNAQGQLSTVVGGEGNSALGRRSLAQGGRSNSAEGDWSTVLGGGGSAEEGNAAIGNFSTIAGGRGGEVSEEAGVGP